MDATKIQLVQKYLRHDMSERDELELSQLKNTFAYQLLIELIDACHEVANADREITAPASFSDDQLELLFIRLLTFHIKKRDAVTFLAELADPSFVQKSVEMLSTACALEGAVADDMPEVRIQTDEDIYATLMARLGKKSRKSVLARLLPSFHSLTNVGVAFVQLWKKPAFIAAVSTVCLAVFLIVYTSQPTNEIYAKYVDNQQMTRLTPSLRSGINTPLRSADSAAQTNIISTAYKLALASYMNESYKTALADFKKAENMLNTLDESQKNAYFSIEFYYYYGMTHLHLAGGKGQHRQHLISAIRCLSASLDASDSSSAGHDNILFFLALAYSMRGHQDHVKTLVAQIPENSPFYSEAQQLRSNN
jgi:hypothetical protein